MTKISLAIKGAVEPTKDFLSLPVRVLKKCSDYEEARKKLTKATYTSDLQTDAEEDLAGLQKRPKRPNQRYLESDSEEEEAELPTVRRRQSPRKKKKDIPSVPPLPTPPSPVRRQQVTRSVSPVIPCFSASRNELPPLLPPPSPLPTSRPSTSTPSAQRPFSCRRSVAESFHEIEMNATLFDKSPYTNTHAIEKKILTCVEEVKAQTHLNTKYLQAIMKKLDGFSLAEETLEEETRLEIDFPLTTKEDILRAEDLLQNEATLKKVVKSLCTIGGETIKLCIRRVLGHLFSNDIAKQINWVGKGGKTAFSSLKLHGVLKATVRKNRLCATATDSEIAAIAKDWFRFACDRDGGRKRRQEQKRAQQAATATNSAVLSDNSEQDLSGTEINI